MDDDEAPDHYQQFDDDVKLQLRLDIVTDVDDEPAAGADCG